MGLRPANQSFAHADAKQPAAMYARVSQQTFEQAVLENIQEFEMQPHEALADAVAQFESQGVNLDNIVKRLPGSSEEDDPPAILAVRALQEAIATATESEDAEDSTLEVTFGSGAMKLTFVQIKDQTSAVRVTEAAATLRTECQRDKSQLAMVVHNGSVDALIASALGLIETPPALPPVLECLAVILSNAEAREQLGVRGICAIIATLRQHESHPSVLTAGFHAVRAAMLVHETHRQQLVSMAGLLKLVVHAMKAYSDHKETFFAACGALRATTLSDDLRARTSKGLEHAKAAVELKVLPLLLAAARSTMCESPSSLAELLATLSRLTVTDQICSTLAQMDALSLAVTELAKHMTDGGVAKQACYFLAAISGNDQCKGSIVSGHGHIAIIQAMLLHPNNAGMQTDAVAALGNMCLRMPSNCEAIAEAGGLPAIVQAFTQHISYERMQSKAPLTIRNLVGRNPELIAPLVELGCEGPLREVMNAHSDGFVHNTAKAALRELHLSVTLKEEWQGTLETAKTLELGDTNDENHWDKFLETPVAQAAIKSEMAAHGVVPLDYN